MSKFIVLCFFIFIYLTSKAHSQYNYLTPQSYPQDCINCAYNYNQYYGPRPVIPFYPYQNNFGYNPYANYYSIPNANYPWWNHYGMMRYSNYNYPGQWNYPGNYPNFPSYPGNGGVVALKPNVYVSGKKGQEFELVLEFLNDSHLLIASPSLSGKWRGLIVANNELNVDGVNYRYLYYDYRFSGHHLQREAGFCGQKSEIIKQMIAVLDTVGFESNEIKDFIDHWPTKLPSSPSYCVFPQEKKELEKEVKLYAKDTAYELTQVNFLVLPKEVMKREIASSIKKWTPTLKKINDENILKIREWGVSFSND